MDRKIPVDVVARHIYLSNEHLEFLFGFDYELTPERTLDQSGIITCEETVDLISENGNIIKDVRVYAPLQAETQVFITRTDAYKNEFIAPVKNLGDIKDSGSTIIVGPKGELKIAWGVCVALRHAYLPTARAIELGIKDNDYISVKVSGIKGGVLDNVLVHVAENFESCIELDIDDANAFDLLDDDLVEIL